MMIKFNYRYESTGIYIYVVYYHNKPDLLPEAMYDGAHQASELKCKPQNHFASMVPCTHGRLNTYL